MFRASQEKWHLSGDLENEEVSQAEEEIRDDVRLRSKISGGAETCQRTLSP